MPRRRKLLNRPLHRDELSTRHVAAIVLRAVYRSDRVAAAVAKALHIDRWRAAFPCLESRHVKPHPNTVVHVRGISGREQTISDLKNRPTLRNPNGDEIVDDTFHRQSTYLDLHEHARAWLNIPARGTPISICLVYAGSPHREAGDIMRQGTIIRSDRHCFCQHALRGAILDVVLHP